MQKRQKQKRKRPNNSQIEKKFMKRLRGTKIQLINAESQLEIQLSIRDQNQKTQKIDQLMVFNIFSSIDLQRKKELLQKWNEATDSWKFTDILDENSFPKYFYDDSTDLSFIINFLMENFQVQLQSEDLIFLQVLCLIERNQLNQSSLEYLVKNFRFINQLVKKGMQKTHFNQPQKKDIKQSYTNNKINSQSNFEEDDQDQTVLRHKKKLIKKTPLQKKKNKVKKGEKRRDEEIKYDKKELNTTANLEQQKILGLNFANFISWAYYYIMTQQQDV